MAGWSDFGAEAGFSFLKTGLSFIAARKEAKAAKAWQAWKNAMVRMQGAQNQNVVTLNRAMTREASAEQAFAIDRSGYETSATTTVAAASVGVTGRSVDQVMMGVARNVAYAQQKRQDDLNQKLTGYDVERRQIAMQTELSVDHTPIPTPGFADFALGLSADLGKLWKDYSKKPDPRTGQLQ